MGVESGVKTSEQAYLPPGKAAELLEQARSLPYSEYRDQTIDHMRRYSGHLSMVPDRVFELNMVYGDEAAYGSALGVFYAYNVVREAVGERTSLLRVGPVEINDFVSRCDKIIGSEIDVQHEKDALGEKFLETFKDSYPEIVQVVEQELKRDSKASAQDIFLLYERVLIPQTNPDSVPAA